MRAAAIVLSLLSFIALTVAIIAGFFAMMPAKGGDEPLAFASWCLRGALVSGALALTLAIVSRYRSPRTGLTTAATVAGAAAMLSSGGTWAIIELFSLAGEHKSAVANQEHIRRTTPVSAADVARAVPITDDVLTTTWKSDPRGTDAKYKGAILAVEVRDAHTGFFGATKCASPLGRGEIKLCLATTVADVSGAVTLVCRYEGTLNGHVDKRPEYDELILEGCVLP